MSNVKIFTDSTSDLTAQIINDADISIVPLYVNFEDKTYMDGVNISTSELYERVEEYGKLPKTSAASPDDFYRAFKPFIDKGDDIVFIGISSKLSSQIQNAHIAASEFPEGRVHIIDSLNLSSGIGLLVLKAADYAKQGFSAVEIAEKIKEIVPKIKTAFVIDTLEYLYKGGRCSGMENLVGSMLKLRPIVSVADGKMVPTQKVMGRRERALNAMLNTVLKQKDSIDSDRVMVTHSMSKDADYLKEELQKNIEVKEIIETQAGCVISSHCGPNTIGILYIEK